MDDRVYSRRPPDAIPTTAIRMMDSNPTWEIISPEEHSVELNLHYWIFCECASVVMNPQPPRGQRTCYIDAVRGSDTQYQIVGFSHPRLNYELEFGSCCSGDLGTYGYHKCERGVRCAEE